MSWADIRPNLNAYLRTVPGIVTVGGGLPSEAVPLTKLPYAFALLEGIRLAGGNGPLPVPVYQVTVRVFVRWVDAPDVSEQALAAIVDPLVQGLYWADLGPAAESVTMSGVQASASGEGFNTLLDRTTYRSCAIALEIQGVPYGRPS